MSEESEVVVGRIEDEDVMTDEGGGGSVRK